MSEELEIKSPCSSCDGNISFPPSALNMEVACPHCGQLTVLRRPAAAVAQPARAPAVGRGGLPRPDARRLPRQKTPPPVPPGRKALHQPPKRPLRRPGPLARSAAGVPGARAGGVHNLKSLWSDDEVDDTLAPGQIRCRSCGTKLAATDRVCARCGWLASPFLRWLRWLGIATVIVLMGVAWQNWRRVRPTFFPPEIPEDKRGVQMLHSYLQKEKFGNLLYIRGAVTNHSGAEMYSIKVEFELLDREGRSLGKTTDQTPLIGGYKIWNFKALVLDPDAVAYTNAVVHGTK